MLASGKILLPRETFVRLMCWNGWDSALDCVLQRTKRLNTVSLIEMFRTWHKVVVILILSWAAVDDCVPGFCLADGPPSSPITDSSRVSRSSQVSSSASVANSVVANNGSQQNKSDKDSGPDDCFCCSTHVTPSPHFTLSESLETTPAVVFVAESHTENWTRLLYHPPRS